jgi:hypothetical protein
VTVRYFSLSQGGQKTAVVAAASAQGGSVEIAVDAGGMSTAEFVRLLTDLRQHIDEGYWPDAPATLWTPADLGANLLAWWNADDLGEGPVSAWADRIAGNAPVQATPAKQPVAGWASFNGVGGVTFDGLDDELTLSGTGSLPVGVVPCEVWTLWRLLQSGSTMTVFGYGGGANSFRVLRRSGGLAQMHDGSGGLVNGGAFSGFGMLGGRFDAALFTLRQNGAQVGTDDAALNTVATRARIGANTGTAAANFFGGIIRHILVTNLLILSDQEKMEGWLAHDARLPRLLPPTHPYAHFPPGV